VSNSLDPKIHERNTQNRKTDFNLSERAKEIVRAKMQGYMKYESKN
jgi:hypothetical protein